MLQLDLQKFYTIGHRGMEVNAVENTLDAFKKAIALNLDLVETDVQTTRDNVPLLFHDHFLDRKTTLHGSIHDYNYLDLKDIPVHTAAGSDRLATFEDLLVLLKPSKVNLLLELKDSFGFPEIKKLISQYDFNERIIVDSFELDSILKFQKLCPNLTYAWLMNVIPFKMGGYPFNRILKILQKHNLSGVSFHMRDLDEKWITRYKNCQKFVFAWGVKSIKFYANVMKFPINGFTAPDPNFLIKIGLKN